MFSLNHPMQLPLLNFTFFPNLQNSMTAIKFGSPFSVAFPFFMPCILFFSMKNQLFIKKEIIFCLHNEDVEIKFNGI